MIRHQIVIARLPAFLSPLSVSPVVKSLRDADEITVSVVTDEPTANFQWSSIRR